MCNNAKTFIRGIFTFLALAVLIFAAGCGGGSSSPGPNNNGGPTMSGGGGGSAASGFLYLGQPSALGTAGKVSGFAVSSDGSLQPTPGSPYSGAGLGLAADPAGHFIYGSDFSKVTSYAVGNDGALNVGSNLPGTFGPRLTIDNTGHTLYALQFDVGGTGNDDYAFLNIGSDGALQNIGTTGQSVDQFALYVTPDNLRLYQPFCFHLSSDIKGFARNADGTLAPFNTSVQIPSDSNHAQFCPQSLAVSPDGKFLVATLNSVTNAASSLGVFNINADGTLTAVAGSPFSTASQGNDIVFDPTGLFIVVGGNNGVSVYQFSAGFTPVLMSGSPVGGVEIDRVMFTRSGKLLFATSTSSQSLDVFTFNGGTLTSAPGSPNSLGFAPQSLALAQP